MIVIVGDYAKVEAGADGAITQYFYNPDAYFRFVDDVRSWQTVEPAIDFTASMGVYCFAPRALAYIEPGERLDFLVDGKRGLPPLPKIHGGR